MTYLDLKSEGNRSMSESGRHREGVEGGPPRDPRDMENSWIA
jgi:hypothetical protein